MAYDIRNEIFQMVDIDGVVALFTDCRINRSGVPDSLYCYDVRETDGGSGIAATLEPFVMVNHWGTVLSKHPFPMNGGFYEIKGDGISYLDAAIGIEEYMKIA